jgi:hypothetical protein
VGQRQRSSAISRIFAWLPRLATRPSHPIMLDTAFLSEHRLRDIGLLDGRGQSLRRPERTGDRFLDGI